MDKRFKSLKEFYPFYLLEHQNKTSRILHFVGTTIFFILLILAFALSKFWILYIIPLVGYGFAWIGHFFYEKNKPATFQYPFYSLASDFILYFVLILGKQKFEATQNQK